MARAFRDIDPEQAILQIYGFFPGYDGHSDYEERLRWIASESRAIRFRGRYDPRDVFDVLAGVDVIVIPSIWWENSPLTVHEAFLAGVPIIAADEGGMAELVLDGKNGLLFGPGNADDLAQQLSRLQDDPDLLPALQAGITPVRGVAQEIDDLAAIYETALRQAQPDARSDVL